MWTLFAQEGKNKKYFQKHSFPFDLFIFYFKDFVYLFVRGRDTGRGRSRLHAGSRTWDSSQIAASCPEPKADAEPLSHPGVPYHIFFIHSSVEGQLGSFHSLDIVDIATINIEIGISGWRSGLAHAFGPGRNPGDPGSNPMSGSRCMEPASPSACVSASLSLSL